VSARLTVAAALFAAAAGSATAAPVLWSSAAGGNNHYYEYVFSAVTWTTALANAENFSMAGHDAYLATATSAAENAFMLNLVVTTVTSGSRRTWLAGSDAETEGVWKWMAGPEAGAVFWNGGAGGSSPTFADWLPGEPNSSSAGEDYLSAYPLQTPDWNDTVVDNPTQGYIVEYSPLSTAVPEPATWALMILGFGGAGAALRRRRVVPIPI
jgi:hypothetical protein